MVALQWAQWLNSNVYLTRLKNSNMPWIFKMRDRSRKMFTSGLENQPTACRDPIRIKYMLPDTFFKGLTAALHLTNS